MTPTGDFVARSRRGTAPAGREAQRAGLVGPGPKPGGTNNGCARTYRYRDQSFTLPCDAWLLEYLLDWGVTFGGDSDAAHGLVSSRNDALDALWATFRSEAVGDAGDYHGLLGCYNLHRADWQGAFYRFWANGWGAPHRAYLYTMQLVRTYVEYADTSGLSVDAAAFDQCVGFVDFLRTMVDGGTASRSADYVDLTNDSGTRACTTSINYRNSTVGYPEVGPGCTTDTPAACDAGFDPAEPCESPDWYNLAVEFVETGPSGGALYCDNGAPTATGCEYPDLGDCAHSAIGGDWRVVAHPVHLAFRGVVMDDILFLARMCWDRAIDVGRDGEWEEAAELALTASRIARYALRIAASHGAQVIHELGHVWLGRHHCEGGKNCCFSVASLAWLCRVRAHLGLPRNELEPWPARRGGDYANDDSLNINLCASCGGGHSMPFYCDTRREGQPGETAVVLGRTCNTPEEEIAHGCS